MKIRKSHIFCMSLSSLGWETLKICLSSFKAELLCVDRSVQRYIHKYFAQNVNLLLANQLYFVSHIYKSKQVVMQNMCIFISFMVRCRNGCKKLPQIHYRFMLVWLQIWDTTASLTLNWFKMIQIFAFLGIILPKCLCRGHDLSLNSDWMKLNKTS